MRQVIIIRPHDDDMSFSEESFDEAAADLAEVGVDIYADNVIDASDFYGTQSYAIVVNNAQADKFKEVFRSGSTDLLNLTDDIDYDVERLLASAN